MTAIDIGAIGRGRRARAQAPAVLVEETQWGYVVRDPGGVSLGLVVAQAVSWVFGIVALVAALCIWIFAGPATDAGTQALRAGATVLALAFAALALWYASRGLETEIQIDTRLGELREVTRNRAGRPTVHGRYGFDSIGSVFIDRSGRRDGGGRGHGVLVLRLGNSAQLLPVAAAPLAVLEPLRDRMGRDLMVRPRVAVTPGRSLLSLGPT